MSTRKIKYVDKKLLTNINNLSNRIGYNRTIPDTVIAQLPDDKLFVVMPLMVHEHINGKAAEPHMRCRIYAGELHPWLILDMDMSVYDFVPEHTIEEAEENEELVAN